MIKEYRPGSSEEAGREKEQSAWTHTWNNLVLGTRSCTSLVGS